jgi:aminoglycoside phosphotransferase (APT) family kinase protein
MESILTAPRMKFDDVAWDRSDAIYAAWKKKLFNEDVFREIGGFIVKQRRGPPEELFNPQKGAFNLIFRMKFRDGGSAIIRFPIPGISVFAEEKVRREVSVMRFIERHTSIRVPHVLHYGMTEESPAGLGPFIVMEYIANDADMADALNTPSLSEEDRCVLDPVIEKDRLRSVYSDMADILLQFSRKSFDQIGSITNNEEDDFDDEWVVSHRPLTINMNELVQLADFPAHLLPQTTFKTASAYFLALAEMHMTHLSIQRNDTIESAKDCRRKYIARCLFRKIARENRLCSYDNGPFKLVCDDFRPTNVLANSEYGYKAVGTIDWEFAYSPPAWLLLERPEYWEAGLDDWTQVYEKRLTVFLQEIEKRETESIQRGILSEDNIRLSQRMRESWQTGDFWVCYAARRSWAFDMLYWAKIDRRFFGEGGMEDKFQLLTEEERNGIDEFVQMKMAEKEERRLRE